MKMKNQESNLEVNRERVKSAQKKELDDVWDEYLEEEDKLADEGE
jgi:uncharacterized Zn finger protein